MTSTSIYLCAISALVGLMAYVVLAGADFGGGVWNLFARGPRKAAQRHAIEKAMGPVWEANHVWLIFVLVVLFTCFPGGYWVIMEALFLPLHIVLAGIMLRGAAFVFRHNYEDTDPPTATRPRLWGMVFGIASVVSPLMLGLSFAIVTAGAIRVDQAGQVIVHASWLSTYTIGCALLALSTCAYLASVYLMVETRAELREDFRRRSVIAGTTTAALAILVLITAHADAPWLFGRLISPRVLPVLLIGGLAFALSAIAVFARWFLIARVSAVAQTILMLLGWGLAYDGYLVYPDITLAGAAAPPATLRFMLIALPLGALVLIPSLFLLFRVFKMGPGNTQAGSSASRP